MKQLLLSIFLFALWNATQGINLDVPPHSPAPTPAARASSQPNLRFTNYEVIPGAGCYTGPRQAFGYFAGLVLNNGTTAAGAFLVKAWFSGDQQLDPGDVPWQSHAYAGLTPNNVVNTNFADPVPTTLTPGRYYVIVQIDPDNTVAEADEGDNQLIVRVFVGAPDFTITGIAGVPAATGTATSMSLDIDVANLAAFALGDLPGTLSVYVHLSDNAVLDPLVDAVIGTAQLAFDQFSQAPLYANGTATIGIDAAIPTYQLPGNYFLFVRLAGPCEQNTANNLSAAVPIAITGGTPAYCPSSGVFPWHEWIARVQLGSFVHASGKSPYSDFTGTVIPVSAGASYPITLTAGFSFETWNEFWRVWIDFNRDGVFSTPDELVQQRILTAPPAGTASAGVTGSAAIPAWAPVGLTRMRVAMKRGDYPSSCESLPFGEVEDYTVDIGDAPPILPCGFSRTYPLGNGVHGFFAAQLGNEFRVIGAKPLLPTGRIFLSIITDQDGVMTGSSEDDVSAPMSQAPVRLHDDLYLFVSTTIDQQLKLEKRPGGGTPIWSATYTVPGSEGFNPVNVVENNAGDIFITGTVDDSPAGAFFRLFVLKVDSAGLQQWLTVYDVQNTPGNFTARGLRATPDGGLIVLVTPNNVANHIVRLAGNGAVLWNTQVTSTPLSPIADAAETTDGRVIVAYTTHSISGPAPANVHVASLTATGELFWTRSQVDLFGAASNPLYIDFAQPRVLPTSNGRFSVAFTGPGGLYLAAVSPAGTALWTRIHAFTPAIGFFDRATDGGYLLAGSLNNQLWLMKTDHVGVLCDTVPPPTDYCEAQGNFPWHDWIARVQLHTLDNASGKSAYSDFTAQDVVLQQDQSYTVTLTAGYSWETFDEYWRVWIDFNHDGVFSTPNELVQQRLLAAPANGTPTATVSGSAHIPSSALTGPTRMRVAIKRGDFPSACETFAHGEVEDYSVTIGTNSFPAPRAGVGESPLEFTVVPNPASTVVHIRMEQLPAGPVSLRLIGTQGQTLKTVRLPAPELELPLDDVPPGFYFVQLTTPDGRSATKGIIVEK